MSGHSKWSKVKHQKGSADIKKGLVFTKLGNAIAVAVKESGGIADPNANFKLRLAIEKARAANMPKANIDHAIERGLGKGSAATLEEVTYEGFAPGKVAVIVKAVTDNRQRTNASLKNIFASHGGNLSGPGSVSYMFEEVGQIKVKRGDKSEDEYMEIALQTDCIDVEVAGDIVTFFTKPNDLHKIKQSLTGQGFEILDASLFVRPTTTVKIEDKETLTKVKQLITELENNDDVQMVSVNLN